MRTLLAAVLLSVALSAYAAPPQRTFVSSTGNDADNCTRTAPCRNFAAAVAAVADGGEVVVLDSAGYGPTTITKGIALIAPSGVYAGVTALSGDAITVANGGSITALRGLTLKGLGGSTGIRVTSASAIHIANCVISGFSGYGIETETSTKLYLSDSESSENFSGFTLLTGTVKGLIDRFRVQGSSGSGLVFFGDGVFSIRDSIVVNSGGYGLSTAGPIVNIERSLFSSNVLAGVRTDGGVVAITNSASTHNGTHGFVNDTGGFHTAGNNLVRGNASGDSTGTITSLTLK